MLHQPGFPLQYRAVFFSTPLLRAINLSITVLLIVLLTATYWYAWRPLPETSGEIGAPVAAKATVARDAIGVPHIRAASLDDAMFLQGYVTAQDRIWQMDALRRLAAGELAEVLGRSLLETDEEARRMRLARIAEEQERIMPAADRAVFAAYARGVNFYLETHRGRLPLEFTLLNYDPRPWKVRDSILAGLEMYRSLTASWRDEITKLHMLERGDRDKVNFLFPLRSGSEPQPGSNAWAVSGTRSATGRAILANDPHLDFSIPSPWYMVHLLAPGLDAAGVSLPGVPAVIIGHNDRIAWGATNLQFDVQDLYHENIDLQSGRYIFRGRLEQARLERGAIAVKGERPIEFNAWVTTHGPIFLSDENRAYALRWSAANPPGFEFPFLDIDRARNWADFTAAIARFPGPAQNFVYADTEGNIGYHAGGHLPIRPDHCPGDVPSDGASGDCEWQGAIPFEQLPQSFNPPSGMIVSANQNPFPPDYRYPVSGNFAPGDRAMEIRALLESRAKWQPEQMLTVQKDVYSAFLNFLARAVVAAWDSSKVKPSQPHDVGEAVDLLRGWNGQMEKGTAAPMLAALVYFQLRQAAGERAAPGLGATYVFPMAPSVVERLLRERPRDWFPEYDQLLMKSLAAAIEEGARIQGSKVSRWDYGQYNELTIAHPVDSHLPLIGKYFNIGPVPMSGSSTTVKQTTLRLGPSMRMIVDLGNLDRSFENITIGQSAEAFSAHYRDQWKAYYGGTSFPMQYHRVDAKQVLVVTPR
jgi:penicillin amidase